MSIGSRLSDEQRTAIAHVTSGARIATVVGRAGAGKTTMMRAAREAWEAAGYTVLGGALAGKAAEGLETEAGIPSRTLASWELRWNEARNRLDNKTIFVLDEAGMVASKQMATFVEAVSKAGAKLVLVGDGTAGKTSLLSQVVVHSLGYEMVPILIKVQKLQRSTF